MKVLWIVNDPLPEALSMLDGKTVESNSTGSWVCALADAISSSATDVDLSIASPSGKVGKLTVLHGSSITYYIFPEGEGKSRYDKGYEDFCMEIRNAVKPDAVHIHGTEYPVGLAYIKACGNNNLVVSLQGLVSQIQKEYFGGIDKLTVLRFISLRDLVRCDTLFRQRRNMTFRGEIEAETIKSVKHVMGRTDWDRSISGEMNPDVVYHHCDEALRLPFYTGRWSYDACRPHTIFVCQGYYPLKGFHEILEAMPLVLAAYPDARIRVAGGNPLRGQNMKNRLLRNGYGRYLAHLIRKYGLNGRVSFIGECNAEALKKELLAANLFISSSSIENSSNAICEAQMLGVPVVASAVGGTPSLIQDSVTGTLYDFGDIHGLADSIVRAFDNSPSFDGTHERNVAMVRHDRERIVSEIISLYEDIRS